MSGGSDGRQRRAVVTGSIGRYSDDRQRRAVKIDVPLKNSLLSNWNSIDCCDKSISLSKVWRTQTNATQSERCIYVYIYIYIYCDGIEISNIKTCYTYKTKDHINRDLFCERFYIPFVLFPANNN